MTKISKEVKAPQTVAEQAEAYAAFLDMQKELKALKKRVKKLEDKNNRIFTSDGVGSLK